MKLGVLKGPPSRLWSLRKHRSVHLLEGEFADVDFLVDQANWLTELTVTAFVDDLGAVASLKQLRRLQLWPTAVSPGSTWSVDPSSLSLLEDLSIGHGVRAKVNDRTRIRYLHVDHIERGFCDRLPGLQFLESLRLDSPGCLPSRFPDRVRELSIAVMKRWPKTLRFSGMEGLDDAEYLFVGRTPLRKTMGSRWNQK